MEVPFEGFFVMAFFALFQLSGLSVARLALPGRAPAEAFGGSVWGSVMFQWLPVAFCLPFGVQPWAHGCALAVALGWGLPPFWKGPQQPMGLSKACQPFPAAAFCGSWAWVAVFCYLCGILPLANGVVYSSQATYGDMSMHLSFLTSLSNQQQFPPDYSLLPGVRLSYPFLS